MCSSFVEAVECVVESVDCCRLLLIVVLNLVVGYYVL